MKGDYGVDEGIQSSPKDQARFFALSAPFDSEFNNVGKDLVLSYTVKHEQNLQCGGAYIKVLKKGALKLPRSFVCAVHKPFVCILHPSSQLTFPFLTTYLPPLPPPSLPRRL